MVDCENISDSDLNLTMRLIRDEVVSRGWKIYLYYVGNSHALLQKPDGSTMQIFASTPPTTSYAFGIAANNKYLSHLIHERAGLPTLRTALVTSKVTAQQTMDTMWESVEQVVVKPLDSGHGYGITLGLTKDGDIEGAVSFARKFSKAVLIQEYIKNAIDIRMLCVGYTFVAAMYRIPARVLGDGKSTIAELISAENDSDRRGDGYRKPLTKINLENASGYLGEKMKDIPPAGEWVQVIGVANLGVGGEVEDITDMIPSWLVKMAEDASRASHLPVAGVDFLLKTAPSLGSTLEDLGPKLIEINKCPALSIHEFPTTGQPRKVAKSYVDYLDTLNWLLT